MSSLRRAASRLRPSGGCKIFGDIQVFELVWREELLGVFAVDPAAQEELKAPAVQVIVQHHLVHDFDRHAYRFGFFVGPLQF